MPATLTYFAGWGLAEQGRWCLAAGGIPFVNRALATHEEFVALRDSGELLFGQLPLLEIDGLKLVQSQAICRHVAKISGMAGKNPGEEALADMVAEAVRATWCVTGFLYRRPCHPRAAAWNAADDETAPVDRGSGSTLRRGDRLPGITHADVLIAEVSTATSISLPKDGWTAPSAEGSAQDGA